VTLSTPRWTAFMTLSVRSEGMREMYRYSGAGPAKIGEGVGGQELP